MQLIEGYTQAYVDDNGKTNFRYRKYRICDKRK